MSLIYEPSGRAREYAELAVNIYMGCEHECLYCFVPCMPFKDMKDRKPRLRKTFSLERLRSEAINLQKQGRTGKVLLCFITDAYQQGLNTQYHLARPTIEILHDTGFSVQVLTKNPAAALEDLDVFTPDDAIAVTLTAAKGDHNLSRLWEPGAPLPEERMEALQKFHDAGIPTWVSLEPIVYPASALLIIEQTFSYVNHYKIGRINHTEHLPAPLKAHVENINWPRCKRYVKLALEHHGFTEISEPAQVRSQTYYFKQSLKDL